MKIIWKSSFYFVYLMGHILKKKEAIESFPHRTHCHVKNLDMSFFFRIFRVAGGSSNTAIKKFRVN